MDIFQRSIHSNVKKTDDGRLVSMILIGDTINHWGALEAEKGEEVVIAEGRKKLRNTCLVFADD